MTAFNVWASRARQIGNGRNPPDLAVREGDHGCRLRGTTRHCSRQGRTAAVGSKSRLAETIPGVRFRALARRMPAPRGCDRPLAKAVLQFVCKPLICRCRMCASFATYMLGTSYFRPNSYQRVAGSSPAAPTIKSISYGRLPKSGNLVSDECPKNGITLTAPAAVLLWPRGGS